MVTPKYFDITYAINAHMTQSDGRLNIVNTHLAQNQWMALKHTFESLGITVSVLEGHPDLPDMVFSANPCLPIWNPKTNTQDVILSHMKSPYRQPEVHTVESWFVKHRIQISPINFTSLGISFEGTGDAIMHPTQHLLFGGYGFRTDPKAYTHISSTYDIRVIPLKLVREDFYHLDTCFSILDDHTVALCPEAFEIEDLKKVHSTFDRVLNIPLSEALYKFSGNCFCPDGKNVILQKGAPHFTKQLRSEGFNPIEVDTSEFIKAGGSVFCLKLNFNFDATLT